MKKQKCQFDEGCNDIATRIHKKECYKDKYYCEKHSEAILNDFVEVEEI